jgi:hypothetical protein
VKATIKVKEIIQPAAERELFEESGIPKRGAAREIKNLDFARNAIQEYIGT